MPKIFINYRTGDGDYAAALLDQDLSRRFGSDNVFRASKSIRPGQDFRKALSSASAATQVLLVVIGPDWLANDEYGNNPLEHQENWTRKEILNALECGSRVIPVLCGRKMPRLSPTELPSGLERLADFQSLLFDSGNRDTTLGGIAEALTELVPGLRDKTAEPAPGQAASTHNSTSGTVDGVAIQAGAFTQDGGSIGKTVINGPTGPVNAGGGPQNVGPTFNGGTTNYIAGSNTGGIHQNFGTQNNPGEDQ